MPTDYEELVWVLEDLDRDITEKIHRQRIRSAIALAHQIKGKDKVRTKLLHQAYGNLHMARGAYRALKELDMPDVFQGLDMCIARMKHCLDKFERFEEMDPLMALGQSMTTVDTPIEKKMDILLLDDPDEDSHPD